MSNSSILLRKQSDQSKRIRLSYKKKTFSKCKQKQTNNQKISKNEHSRTLINHANNSNMMIMVPLKCFVKIFKHYNIFLF